MLNVPLNGTEYESPDVISKDIFTEEALSDVIINGEDMGEMKLHSIYPFNGGTRFSLMPLTREEIERKQLAAHLASANEELTMTQLAIADVYEMLLGGE